MLIYVVVTGVNMWLAVFSVAAVATLYTVVVSIHALVILYLLTNIWQYWISKARLLKKQSYLLVTFFQSKQLQNWQTCQHTCTYYAILVGESLSVIRLKGYKLDFVECWICYTRLTCNDILYTHVPISTSLCQYQTNTVCFESLFLLYWIIKL